MTKKFDENKHPRDETGKFTDDVGTKAEQEKLKSLGISMQQEKKSTLSAEEKRLQELTVITVVGEPVAKERARVAGGRAFTPKRTKAYEEQVAWEYKKQKGKFYDKEPVTANIKLYFTPPKRTTKRELEKISKGQAIYTGKKDIDNIAKSILDGLNGVAYIDDRQVVELKISKQYTLEETRAEIEIKEIGK